MMPQEDDAPDLRDEFRRLVKRSRMSQVAVAAALGYTPQSVRRWLTEAKTHVPPPQVAVRLLKALVAARPPATKAPAKRR